jgi:hypothetical protein
MEAPSSRRGNMGTNTTDTRDIWDLAYNLFENVVVVAYQ